MRRRRPPVVITDAARSPAEELRSRQTRYIVMMLVRAGFLVLAAVLAMAGVPHLGLWVAICLVGAVLLPWLAVVLANNRAPQPRYRLSGRFRSPMTKPATTPATTPVVDPVQPALPRRTEPTVIDAEP